MYSVTTWNINGIRSAKDLKLMLDNLNSDIICLQETKITREMLTEPNAIVPGYSSYFDFCQKRTGYSGVATYCRDAATPVAAEPGLAGSQAGDAAEPAPGRVGHYGALPAELEPAERKELDGEGRCVVTLHKMDCQCSGSGKQCHLAVVNVYCPRVDPDRPERLEYKLLFYRALRLRAAALRAAGHHVMVVGDLNCSHKPIDNCDPGDLETFRASPSRQFLDSWLWDPSANGTDTDGDDTPDDGDADDRLVDAFRLLHPAVAESYTCWNTQKSARLTNFGTRIDYVLTDRATGARLANCENMAEVMGSDHCPVRAAVRGRLLPAARCPPSCTRFYPEFAGRQATLKELFARLPAGKNGNGKRPADQGAVGKGKGKKARSGQATLLGFVQRTVVKVEVRAVGGVAENAVSDKDSGIDSQGESTGSDDQSSQSTDASLDSPVAQENRTIDNGGVSGALKPDPAPASGGAASVACFWRQTLRVARPPACRGHREPCVQRTVKKAGPNLGKVFWCCARGVGKPGDPEARCGHFEWLSRK